MGEEASIEGALLGTNVRVGRRARLTPGAVVGEGTCSRISECMEDADIRRELALAGCDTVAKAVRWAREDEDLFLEQGLNQREGNDDDWHLAAYRDFKAPAKANPVE